MPAPPRRDLEDTMTRLIEVYEAWGQPDKAATYRSQLRLGA
jgi:hypothetical protein